MKGVVTGRTVARSLPTSCLLAGGRESFGGPNVFSLAKSERLMGGERPDSRLAACLHAAGFWMHATCSVLHATPPGRSSPGQKASTAAIHVLFPSGENVLLCSQEGNALWERTVRFQPLLPFDRDQSGPAATGSLSAVHWMAN